MKNKLKFLTVLALMSIGVLSAQTGVGTTTPHTSSVLDVFSSTKGFLPPRLTTAQRDLISSPANGLVIFNVSKSCLEWYNGTIWINGCGDNPSLVLMQVGNEGDSPNTVPSFVTAAQLASVPGVTGVVPANQTAYQAYIDANPSLFSAPATVAEINAMITAVNAAQSILAQVGNEGDSPNTVPSVVTTTQLASVPGVTGVVPANQTAYQAYIDANPSLFSAPATVAEINAMIAAVNTGQTILAQVGNEGDSPNTVPSVVTAAQLASVPGVTGVVPANQTAYQAYIDANPSLFSAPATVAEINAMITAVNAAQSILAQVGNEGDSPNTVPSFVTAAQLASVPGVVGVVPANQTAYQAYIDANPSLFSAPATVAEINAMITAVNAAQTILAQVGNEGDSPNTFPSVVTTTQLASVPGVTGVVPANQTAYQAYIDANPSLFSAPATVAEINAMITAVNTGQSILAQVGNEGDSPNTVPSVVTAAQLASVPGVTGVVPANQTAYQAYIDANPSLFSAPATVAEINAMITAVNAAQTILAQVGNEGDSPNTVPSFVTAAQLASVPGVVGVVPANQTAYQAYIDANPSLFSAPATVAEINAMITAVNAAQSILAQVGNEGDSPNTVPSVVTTTQLASVPGVTGVVPANQTAYQAYIDANPLLFSAPATVAEINAMIAAVNTGQTILAQVGNEGDSPNTVPSVVTAAQLASIPGVTGVVPANQAAYQAYIDANPSLFSAPATVAEINAMIVALTPSQSSVTANCTTAGFNAGTYTSGVALSGRTYSVTLTNNSFSTATIAFSAADLTFSDPSISAGTPTGSPALSGGNATLASGASVVITYPITGTPSACGTLTGTWTKLSLSCVKTVAVNPNISCATASWTAAITPNPTGGLVNSTSYSGTYSIPYTGGGCTLPAESFTQNGLTFSYVGGSIGASGNLIYSLSGSYNGTSGGFVTFTTGSGCNVIVGVLKSCKEIKDAVPSSIDGVYTIDPDGAGTAFGAMQAQCDMTTDGGGWTMILNYVRPANNTTANSVRSTFPILGSSTLGANEAGSSTLWGHAGNSLANAIPFTTLRFFGVTSGHSRILHFKTTSGVSYVKTGSGTFDGINANFSALTGHNSSLPASAGANIGNRGNGALTDYSYQSGSSIHWACGPISFGNPNRWEVDDFPDGPQNSTIHRVWVR